MEELIKLIREIPDFPKKGILFRDITPLLENAGAFEKTLQILKKNCPARVAKVVAIESRGFILGGALASKLKAGFVPVRKGGKLPYKKSTVTYALEYGQDTLEMHSDGIKKGEKVVLVDDLLATGGTAEAAARLVEKLGGRVVKIIFLIELKDLGGKEKLREYSVFSLLSL